jgi:hypothetical protein
MDLPDGTYWSRWREFLRDDVVSRGYVSRANGPLQNSHQREMRRSRNHALLPQFSLFRFVKDDLVIRLNHAPTSALIGQLSRDFADLLTDGQVERASLCPRKPTIPTRTVAALADALQREDFSACAG